MNAEFFTALELLEKEKYKFSQPLFCFKDPVIVPSVFHIKSLAAFFDDHL